MIRPNSATLTCLLLLGGCGLSDPCANSVLSQATSPDGRLKAVVFQRNCGATTGFSTHVSLVPLTSVLPNEAGNIFVTDTNHGAAPSGPGGGPKVFVKWVSSTQLQVACHSRARTFNMQKQFDSISISYKLF